MNEASTHRSRGAGADRVAASQAWPAAAHRRVAIEDVCPEIDGGRYAIKRVVGDIIRVEADIFSDGHELIGAAVLYRSEVEEGWSESPMRLVDNDRWVGTFPVPEIGRYRYSIAAWRDHFATVLQDAQKKQAAGQQTSLEMAEARDFIARSIAQSDRASDADRSALNEVLVALASTDEGTWLRLLMREEVRTLIIRSGLRPYLTQYDKELPVRVDRRRAAHSAWYELMPRSQAGDTGRHGTLADVISRLPYIEDLGFDVLYLMPIHPIGRVNRKGRNNSLTSRPDDRGSPYAIGAREGGHDAIHPELGTFEDFEQLVTKARQHGLEIALDFAIQCAPDHPWIEQHPEWFDWRPDGTLRFAENPPKKYEDIVNVHFYRDAFPSIWYALRDIVLFWADHGVRIFRVDNPHTKPFPFWEWLIREVLDRHCDVIFLSEAFTRPKPMKHLAKLGFTQSYTYFTWRNGKQEITDYLLELTRGPSRDYMRPNFFTNTPDINPYYLQTSGRAGFQVRAVLAATLGGNYGIYNGFELCEGRAVPGKEEYADSEKYELKAWDWDRPGHIRDDIRLLNKLRREREALQAFENVSFYNAWNDNILYYGKATADRSDFLLVAVNLDPHNAHGAHFEVPLWEFGLPDDASIEVEDLVTGHRFGWHGKVQHMWIDPGERPYRIWRLLGPVVA